MNQQISIVMSSFLRSDLLDLGLSSIVKNKPDFPIEIVVVNDGKEDMTEEICSKYSKYFEVKYFFSGHRNKNEIIFRGPAISNNIGIRHSTSEIVVLTCPEIFHLNTTLNRIVLPLLGNDKRITIPKSMYFDDTGEFTKNISEGSAWNLRTCNIRQDHVQMPFLLGIWKKNLIEIGAYDEDFIGYASEDNDLMQRLITNGCKYYKVDAEIVHLYHGPRCPEGLMWDNPKWAYNRKLFESRKNKIIRNTDKDWGVLPGA